MKSYIVEGGTPLSGTVFVSGAKNAALPILFATLLVEGRVYLEGIPDIRDTALAIEILRALGADCLPIGKGAYVIDTTCAKDVDIKAEMAAGMRASSYLLGAMCARFGHCKLPLPGGCNLGERPIDLHLNALSSLGAETHFGEGFVDVLANLLYGNEIVFATTSVGATVNALLAATAARGKTVLRRASFEPHVTDLVRFLKKCGAAIEGEGSDTLTVYGGKPLSGCAYSVMADAMEAGTFLIAAAATGGEVTVKGICPLHLTTLCRSLKEAGAIFTLRENEISVKAPERLCGICVKTAPYPAFPTDLHPQLSACLCKAVGESVIEETVWPSRFQYVAELQKCGGKFEVKDNRLYITGVPSLLPAEMVATDLRGGAAAVTAALMAKGKSKITGAEMIERGYENLPMKLRALGAEIYPL